MAGPGCHGGNNAINAGANLRGSGLRDRGGAVQIELDYGGIGEQAVLDDGLVRAGAAIMRGAIGGQCQQRNTRRGGFDHGGHEVCDGCAGRCNYRGHLAGARGQAEGEEGGGAFIDAHMEANLRRIGGLDQSAGQRGGPGTRAHHGIDHAETQQLIDDEARYHCGWGRGSCRGRGGLGRRVCGCGVGGFGVVVRRGARGLGGVLVVVHTQ